MLEDDDGDGQFAEDDVLELDQELGDDTPDDADLDGDGDGEDEQPFVGFADDGDEEADDDTPLVKKLRQQLREKSRELAKRSKPDAAPANNDPEPEVPERPRSVADFDYDEDRFNEAIDAHLAAKDEHTAWKSRQAERQQAQQREAEEQGRTLEQQRKALGVSDYEQQSAKVKDALSEHQLAVLVQAADNPARLIYALGRSDTRLDALSGQANLAKFAALIGTMEKEIKVGKKQPPAPESRVRGATASVSIGSSDKKLAALEAKAAKTGDRSELIKYKAAQKQRAA